MARAHEELLLVSSFVRKNGAMVSPSSQSLEKSRKKPGDEKSRLEATLSSLPTQALLSIIVPMLGVIIQFSPGIGKLIDR